MTDDNVNVVVGDESMERMKVIWTFNPITIGSIVAAVISGSFYMSRLENRVDNMENYRVTRSALVDKAIGDLNETTKDLPFRLKAEETTNKEQGMRLDRIADLMLSGQDALRRDLTSATEAIRKDISGLSTKVEVIGSKVDMANGKPQPGSYRLP